MNDKFQHALQGAVDQIILLLLYFSLNKTIKNTFNFTLISFVTFITLTNNSNAIVEKHLPGKLLLMATVHQGRSDSVAATVLFAKRK
jgi:cadmium resistance protein CadD (predicted permease)